MISVDRKEYLVIPLIILFALETWAVTDYKQPYLSQVAMTLIFIVAGILIATLPFIIDVKKQNDQESSSGVTFIPRVVFGIFFLALAIFVIRNSNSSLSALPIDYHNADMIPQIKVC